MNWRDDHGIVKYTTYKKKFAWRPVYSLDGEKIWWHTYYTVYENWTAEYLIPIGSPPQHMLEKIQSHTRFLGKITEADYLIRKLAESL